MLYIMVMMSNLLLPAHSACSCAFTVKHFVAFIFLKCHNNRMMQNKTKSAKPDENK